MLFYLYRGRDRINQIIQAKIYDENANVYLAQDQGTTYQLLKNSSNQSIAINDTIEGYIYEDKDGIKRIQYPIPEIISKGYTWGQVVNCLNHLGVFLDVGFTNKDIVISLDDLPEDKNQWPKNGDSLYIRLEIDNKGRYWGKIANREEIKEIVKIAPPRLMNQDIQVIIFNNKGIGYSGISQEGFITFIHESEITEPLRLGQKISVRVIKVHSDGRLNASMKPRAYEVMDEDAMMILAILSKSTQKYLALHDKSDPVEISKILGISKSQFKRAIGRLMKQNKIKQVINDGIYLLSED